MECLFDSYPSSQRHWIPAFAGMTVVSKQRDDNCEWTVNMNVIPVRRGGGIQRLVLHGRKRDESSECVQ